MSSHDELAAYERQFRRSGLPLFIEDYSASQDVFNRAAPFFALVFVVEMVGATDLDWPWWLNLLAATGGLAILLSAFGLLNRWSGRPFFSFPRQLGVPELAAFVVLPALLPLIFGGQMRQVGGVMLGNLLLLGVVYLVVGYGLLATIGWALARVVDELAVSLTRLLRTLPMLLIFSIVLFINTEMWQVFAALPGALFVLVVALFAVLGAAFLVLRLPGEVGTLVDDAGAGGPPLSRRQRANVGLMLIVSQMVQVLVVSAGVGAFFVVLGALAMSSDVTELWDVPLGKQLVEFGLFDSEVAVTETLLKVAGGIASITGLYYAISILTDATYREEFLDGAVEELRGIFTTRIEYLELRRQSADSDHVPPAVT